MTPEDDKLPKQDLLLKLLNMTTSDNDNITCMSIRKANELLVSAGWTWEKLLAGKIRVVADPFGAVAAPNPFENDSRANRATTPQAPQPPHNPRAVRTPPRPTAPPPPRPQRPPPGYNPNFKSAQPQPAAAPMPFTPRAALGATTQISTRSNNYFNHCYCCGDSVKSGDGFIFKPIEINPSAKNGWEVLCKTCNNMVDAPISRSRAPKWANLNSTANL